MEDCWRGIVNLRRPVLRDIGSVVAFPPIISNVSPCASHALPIKIVSLAPFNCELTSSPADGLTAKLEWLFQLDQYQSPTHNQGVEKELCNLENKKLEKVYIGILFQECFFFWLRNYPPFVASIKKIHCSIQIVAQPVVKRTEQTSVITAQSCSSSVSCQADIDIGRPCRKAVKLEKYQQKKLQKSRPSIEKQKFETIGEFDVLLQVYCFSIT